MFPFTLFLSSLTNHFSYSLASSIVSLIWICKHKCTYFYMCIYICISLFPLSTIKYGILYIVLCLICCYRTMLFGDLSILIHRELPYSDFTSTLYSTVWMYHSSIDQTSTLGHLDCFQFFAIIVL